MAYFRGAKTPRRKNPGKKHPTLGLGQSLFVPNVDKFVRHAVSTIGYQEITNGYWPHALLDWVVSWNSHFFSKRGAVRSEKMLREYLAEQGKKEK